MNDSNIWVCAILVAFGIGCGDDDVPSLDSGLPGADAGEIDGGMTPDDDAGPTDAGTGFADTGSSDTGTDAPPGTDAGVVATFPRSFSGTTEESYNFLNTVTFETFRPPAPYADSITITPSGDFSEIDVEWSTCRGTARFSEIGETSGNWIYDFDLATNSCDMMAGGEMVNDVPSGGRVFWGSDAVRAFVSGDGTITDSTSLFIVEFTSD